MKPNNNSEFIYIFAHIPKTAGTTLRNHLRRQYKKDEVLFLYRDIHPLFDTKEGVETYIKSLSEKQRNKIKAIIGHKVFWGVDKLFTKKSRYITFVRDAVDIIISQYNYMRTETAKGNKNTLEKLTNNNKIISFEDFSKKETSHNNMIRYLKSHDFIESENNISLDKFYYVGLVENTKDDLLFICHLLNISPFVINFNMSKKYFKLNNENLKKDIIKNNQQNTYLHDLGKKHQRIFIDQYPEYNEIIKKQKLKYKLLFIFFFPLQISYFLAQQIENYTKIILNIKLNGNKS